jgi:hypothetical protein
VKKWHGSVNGWRDLDLHHLAKLTLVAGPNIPLNVSFKHGPPVVIEEGVVHEIELLVAELVMCVMDEHIVLGWRGIELVATVSLALLKLSASDKEVVHSTKETGEHITS